MNIFEKKLKEQSHLKDIKEDLDKSEREYKNLLKSGKKEQSEGPKTKAGGRWVTIRGKPVLIGGTRFRTFSSGKKADAWGGSQKSMNPDLNESEEAVLGEYKGDRFLDVNDQLRTGGYSTEIVEYDGEAEFDTTMDRVFEKSSLSEAVTVFRGASPDMFYDEDENHAGAILEDGAFLSTSLMKSTAEGFSDGVMIEIRVPKGAPALWMERWKITGGSEHEILFPRNSKMKVVKDSGADSDPRVLVTEYVHE